MRKTVNSRRIPVEKVSFSHASETSRKTEGENKVKIKLKTAIKKDFK